MVDKVQLKIEKSKIYRNLDILMSGSGKLSSAFSDWKPEERNGRSIAKEFGISRSYVSRIEKRALMKLYHEF